MKDLQQIKASIEQELNAAVSKRSHHFHQLVLADSSADARFLVLRGSKDNKLWFHTHAQSPKVTKLLNDPVATVLGYDAESKQQIRLSGHVKILRSDAQSNQKWQQLSISARRCYLTKAPGMILSNPGPGYSPEFDQAGFSDLDATEYAQINFTRLEFTYHTIDYLHLAATGHQRAIFELVAGSWQANWVAP